MSGTEQARKNFNQAKAELDQALIKFQKAQAALHAETGEFHGADKSAVKTFSQISGDSGCIKAEF